MRFRRMGACAAIAAVYVALSLLVAIVSFKHIVPRTITFLILATVFSLGSIMLAQFGFVVSVARLQMRPSTAAYTALFSAIALAGLTYLLMRAMVTVPLVILFIMALRSLSMMLLAASVGYLVSFIVREPNILLPVGLFAAMVDFWGVNWGPVSKAIAKAPGVVAAVSVHVPTPVPGLPGTTIGVGDFVFMALFFGILYRFSMNVKGAFWLGYALLTLAMAVVMITNLSVPALVPMALAVLVMNMRQFKLSRDELRSTAIAGVFLAAIMVIMTVFVFK